MKKIPDIVRFIIICIFTCLSSCFVCYVYRLNVLKLLYFIIFSILILLIWIFILIQLTRKNSKKITKIILSIFAVLLSIIYFIGYRYSSETIKFVSNMTNITYEYQKYSVLTFKDNTYENIGDLKNKNIGFISTNINLKETTKKLKEDINYNKKEYTDVGTLISSIYNGEIDALVLDESYIELLEENNVQFYNESKELYSFEIKVEKKDTRRKVDINETPFIIYISGSDSRTGVKSVARSDVNIVAVVNPNTNKILLVSIPRDYYVQLHGTTGLRDKLTHAGIYGVDMSRMTIEDLLGISINYDVKVSFATVINVVDVIDGIDIYSEKAFKPHTNKNCQIVEGTQHLNGECALAFTRERYTYLTGDRHRGQNQQAVITAIINKLNNPKYLVKYNDILKAIDGSFETNLSYEEITTLAKYQLSELKSWSVESVSLDGTGSMQPTYSMGRQNLYVMIPNEATIEYAKGRINEYLGK